ncbi:hypothetical protein L9F63_023732, partial [Diploptera punctata]
LDYGVRGSREMFVVAAAEPGSVNAEHTSNLEAKITFIPSQQLLDTEEPHLLILTFISISDHYGNRWVYRRGITLSNSKSNTIPASRKVVLSLETNDQ